MTAGRRYISKDLSTEALLRYTFRCKQALGDEKDANGHLPLGQIDQIYKRYASEII